MRRECKTLVMAGSREAHALIRALRTRNRHVIASLPEPERMFDALPVPTRLGGFHSAGAMRSWLQDQNVSTVIDASHTFDSDISNMISQICARSALPYLRILRPIWRATANDHWRHFDTITKAARAVPERSRVFTNTGWPSLPEYSEFAGTRLFMRQTHDASSPVPFPYAEFVQGTPPFSQFQEEALFERLGITHLICRNVGGAASMSKILAARAMNLPVFMISRPVMSPGVTVVETIAEALAWEANI